MDAIGLGRRIRELRRQRGLTQSELAERLGVSFQQIQKYEHGRSTLTVSRLQALAAALGVSPAELLGGTEASAVSQGGADYGRPETFLARLTEEEAAFLRQIRGIASERVRRSLLALLKAIAEADCGTSREGGPDEAAPR